MSEPTPSPFHAGERAIQSQLGVAEPMEEFGRKVIRDYMPDQHRQFYAQLPMLVAATVDPAGDPWATVLEGRAGFAHSPSPTRLRVDNGPARDDPARAGWRDGAAVGFLGIELHTRRRNRINGQLALDAEGRALVTVEHAFGNCPQYIHARNLAFVREPETECSVPVLAGDAVTSEIREFIQAADTFFVASYLDHEDGLRSVDASHRGGKPGFVRVQGQRLSIPDFSGNLHFNTLGNFLLNPRGGIAFVDFASGDVLQVTGTVVLDFHAEEVRFFQGAERMWYLDVSRWVLRRGALALRGKVREAAMDASLTGSWQEADALRQSNGLREHWRPFVVKRIDDESTAIRSFWLAPSDGLGLPLFEAGQHLPLRLLLPGDAVPTERTYTLSVAPADHAYRISVRKQGRLSSYLHEHTRVGDAIEAKAPRGTFTVDPHATRPLVLLSAGVGITPMLAMLRHVVYEGLRKLKVRPTYFIHGGRNRQDRGFAEEVEQLAEAARGAVRVVQALTEPGSAALQGVDYHAIGRVDIDLLKAVLPFDDFDFYLCGPVEFMQSLYADLRALRVPDERIHAEAFGPAGLRRDSETARPEVATVVVPVVFTRSGKEARWAPGSGSLLELAESRGLVPTHACRQGMCGNCSHTLQSGEVAYARTPAMTVAPGQVLLCQAVPAAGSGPIQIDV